MLLASAIWVNANRHIHPIVVLSLSLSLSLCILFLSLSNHHILVTLFVYGGCQAKIPDIEKCLDIVATLQAKMGTGEICLKRYQTAEILDSVYVVLSMPTQWLNAYRAVLTMYAINCVLILMIHPHGS